VIERLLGKRAPLDFAPRPVQVAATFVLAMIGWVIFRSDSLAAAGAHLAAMFGAPARTAFPDFLAVGGLQWTVLAIAALLVWGAPTTQRLAHRANAVWVVPLQLVFLLSLVHLHHQHHVPFLYFQF
jgi:alginate O-acetyltransferase complex protein AlgI